MLQYFASRDTRTVKGTVNLHCAVAVVVNSPVRDVNFAVKVALWTTEFYILTDTQTDCEVMLLYIKLASNNEIDRALTLAERDYVPRVYTPAELPETPKSSCSIASALTFSLPDDTNENAIAQQVPPSYKVIKKAKGSLAVAAADQPRREDELRLPSQRSAESFRAAGLKYLWNFQLNNAMKCFELVKHNDIRSAIHWAEVTIFRLIITGKRSDVRKSYEALLEVEATAAQRVDPTHEIVGAEVALYKSVLLILGDQRLRAFLSMRTAWKVFNKFTEDSFKDPDLKCRVLFGQGVIELLVTLVPSSVDTVLKLVGFGRGRQHAIELLERCRANKEARSPLASLLLAVFYMDFGSNPAKAEEVLRDQLSKYPNSVLIQWVSSVVLWKQAKVVKAINVLHHAIWDCGEELEGKATFLRYELGWFYFLQMNWHKARELFEFLLHETSSLSSELDSYVKQAIKGKLSSAQLKTFNELALRRTPVKKRKANWLDSQSELDRVFLPHKACLVAQLASCMAAVSDSSANFWLKVTRLVANTETPSRSKLDIDFGVLADVFLVRHSCAMLPYETIYFLKQATKLQSSQLQAMFLAAESHLMHFSHDVVEEISAKLIQILSLCLLGSTDEASKLADFVGPKLYCLPDWAFYLVPHTLYWSSRAFIAELRYEDAVVAITQARKAKQYPFNIHNKLTRVLELTKSRLA
jgi:hypothetical protein